jgi:spore maturation protein A
MLNYIWIGLILVGLFVAVGNDIVDEVQNPYRNGQPFVGVIQVTKTPSGVRQSWEGDLVVASDYFNSFYGAQRTQEAIRQPVTVSVSADGAASLAIHISDASPSWWRQVAKSAGSKDRLLGNVLEFSVSEDRSSARVQVVLESIRFVKLKSVTQASLDYAALAVNIALGLIGIMALWLGVMKVAEEAGLLQVLTRMLTPLTKRLFPDVPPDHPAVGAIIMNIAANMSASATQPPLSD